jgi:hypothetical protein
VRRAGHQWPPRPVKRTIPGPPVDRYYAVPGPDRRRLCQGLPEIRTHNRLQGVCLSPDHIPWRSDGRQSACSSKRDRPQTRLPRTGRRSCFQAGHRSMPSGPCCARGWAEALPVHREGLPPVRLPGHAAAGPFAPPGGPEGKTRIVARSQNLSYRNNFTQFYPK